MVLTSLGDKDNLVEFVGNNNLVVTQFSVNILPNYRAADNVQRAVFYSPFAALLLKLLPVPGIELVVLRAYVCELVCLVHRLGAPFHVTCGSHMSPVPA